LLGAVIILIFAILVDVESKRLHMTVNGLLGAFMGLVIYIIVILDHPFTGKMKIEPEEYKTILQMEKEKS
jgi:dolichyl-phosphate-mannose--protein O-mannosyl transferase